MSEFTNERGVWMAPGFKPLPAATERSPDRAPVTEEELARVQRKCAALRREVKVLRANGDAKAQALVREEAQQYRKALSNIVYRLDNGGVSEADLRSIVEAALALRGVKPWRRTKIEALRDD